ncbi:uncharacterized protein PRCAT00000685001 [Priceomyces carsonii]|uniref:uncharacterized protein n=1 Tax=Priceomyces carsonii TaxID=28549 RepID=UPI002ED81163|nr:unnamed protein product [Priceomyces carsonii]
MQETKTPSGLFRAKQNRSKKNLHKLSISTPVLNASTSTLSSPLTPGSDKPTVIVLVLKYVFKGEHSQELSVSKGDHVILIERPGNGWLKVQSIDKANTYGLVPASYVDIALNDSVNPISLQWLNAINYDVGQGADVVRPYPKSLSVTNIFQTVSSRFWYRIEFKMSSKESVYVGKFYQDFYKLHMSILNLVDPSQLPKLPQPLGPQSSFSCVSISSTNIDKKFLDDLMVSGKQMNTYFDSLLKVKKISTSQEIYDFMNSSRKYVTGENETLPDLEINNRLFPGSISVIELMQTSTFYSPTAPLSPIKKTAFDRVTDSVRPLNIVKISNKNQAEHEPESSANNLQHSTSSNTLMSYTSLIDRYDNDDESSEEADLDVDHSTNDLMKNSPTISSTSVGCDSKTDHCHRSNESQSSDECNSSLSRPFTPNPNNFRMSDELNPHSPVTPSTPIFEDDEPQVKMAVSPLAFRYRSASTGLGQSEGTTQASHIKIKLTLQNTDDMIALKIKRTNLMSIVYLKKLLSYKIYKDYNLINHYGLRVKDSSQELDDDQLLAYIKSQDKVSLVLVRTRRSHPAA